MLNKLRSFIWLAIAIFCVISFRVVIDSAIYSQVGWLTWLMAVFLGVAGIISTILFGIYQKRKD